MSVATKPPIAEQRPLRRLWKSPRSKIKWISLLVVAFYYLGVLLLYLQAMKQRSFSDLPGTGSLSKFGFLILGTVMFALTYTLRRRFMRFLPGKAQDWLWVHNWLGIAAVLIAFLHSNFSHVLHDYCFSYQCLHSEYFGPFALYGLLLLVSCGIAGRLIDLRQTRIIAQEASSNGVGIVQALEERVLELRYTVERLYAGKSAAFKQACIQALNRQKEATFDSAPLLADLQAVLPSLPPGEQLDFQRAGQILSERARLLQSMWRQQRAQQLMRRWRTLHIVLACLALAAIGLHLGFIAVPVLLTRLHIH
jgi:hypothetical protein